MNATKELALKNDEAEAADMLHNDLDEVLEQAIKHGYGEIVIRAFVVKGKIQQTKAHFEKNRRFE